MYITQIKICRKWKPYKKRNASYKTKGSAYIGNDDINNPFKQNKSV